MWNTSTGDHATTTPFDVPYYAGYQADSNYGGRYGYQRYGNNAYALTTDPRGGVTEGSDTIAGGAVASWVWNGAQFINSSDYGRYMQADVAFVIGGAIYNPTEAGDHFSGSAYGLPGKWHGSPIYANQVTNGVHITRSVPLDWGIAGGVPVTENNPYIYSGMQIGKNLTLDFGGLGGVAQYEMVVYSPAALPATDATQAEIPTEPRRVFRRPFGLSLYAAIGVASRAA